LPMNRYFVLPASSANSRRGRDNNNNSTSSSSSQRVVNASVHFMVLHSVAMLIIQPDYTEMKEYALHKIGASFSGVFNDSNNNTSPVAEQ
jgi:hypothetical protein